MSFPENIYTVGAEAYISYELLRGQRGYFVGNEATSWDTRLFCGEATLWATRLFCGEATSQDKTGLGDERC